MSSLPPAPGAPVTPSKVDALRERAHATLAGLAVGDALGMPTQMLPRKTVVRLFPTLTGFEPGPQENPISPGRPAGEYTDDTQQALMLAQLLVEGHGRIDAHRFVEMLAAWAKEAEMNGTEQLGPSSRKAIDAILNGAAIDDAGSYGATNGASMRIAPIGIAFRADDLETLIDQVQEACAPTHNTGVAIAGASAVAAAISYRLEGCSFDEALQVALAAAEAGAERGHHFNGSDVGERIKWAVDYVADLTVDQVIDRVSRLVGTGVQTQETVAAAFALASRWPNDPWQACLAAAQLGGDTDTVSAITGAITGAGVTPEAFPDGALAHLETVNNVNLRKISDSLVDLRLATVNR
ncbi:ADP-ribosylglycohydrolase family protein [Planotetraspora sp. GP83]|uniref:ADP-ribosylglycohydrolase family protein n=1 Tax=Planotetraspora sp. GP83 TaxID=3156264 RepID=UPI003512E672